jgi:CspA family cold shock protein
LGLPLAALMLFSPADDGADLFVQPGHIQARGYRSLDENQRVEFGSAQVAKGPQAE